METDNTRWEEPLHSWSLDDPNSIGVFFKQEAPIENGNVQHMHEGHSEQKVIFTDGITAVNPPPPALTPQQVPRLHGF